jgi:hypothetical protein
MGYVSFYSVGNDPTPKPLHIGLYPDYKTQGEVLSYLRETGLTGWPHQSTRLADLHVTLMYNGSQTLPVDFPKEQVVKDKIDLSGLKWSVKPLSLSFAKAGDPIAILFPNVQRIERLSSLFHKQFKLTSNPSSYIPHMSLSKIQEFPYGSKHHERCRFKHIKDYYQFPAYTGRMVFDMIKTSFNQS